MTLPYDTGFPTTNDSLGTTRAKFFGNTQSVKDFVNVNHYDFGDVLYGNHKWVWYGRLTADFPDTSIPSNQAIATYGKTDGTRTQLWYQPSNDATGANAIQLTAGDVTQPNFSTFLDYGSPAAGISQKGGWTFLPGGLIMQYGTFTNGTGSSSSERTIEFPIPWAAGPLIYTFTATIYRDTARAVNIDRGTAFTTTEFTFILDAAFQKNDAIFWSALGKI